MLTQGWLNLCASGTKMSGDLETNSFQIKGLPEVLQQQQEACFLSFTSALMDSQVKQTVAKAGENMTADLDVGGYQRVINLIRPVIVPGTRPRKKIWTS